MKNSNMEMKIYRCAVCGQTVVIVKGMDVPLVCCGEDMEEVNAADCGTNAAAENEMKNENAEMKFYRCAICGQTVAIVKETDAPIVCCGENMEEVNCDEKNPGDTEASEEEHVPVITVKDGTATVTVGTKPHPMTEDHLIEWICLVTDCGSQCTSLLPGQEPKAAFRLREGEKVKAAYAYSNLHGLWKSDKVSGTAGSDTMVPGSKKQDAMKTNPGKFDNKGSDAMGSVNKE